MREAVGRWLSYVVQTVPDYDIEPVAAALWFVADFLAVFAVACPIVRAVIALAERIAEWIDGL